MPFHLGKPILVMSMLATAAAAATYFTQRGDRRADVEAWVFSENQWRTFTGSDKPADYETAERRFEKQTGKTADIKLVQYRALNTRLSTLFMGNTRTRELPDVVAIEIGAVGRFFRPPVDEVGLLPLNDFIERYGWSDKIVRNRLAPWSKGGTIFGIPSDVHPVLIAYNDKLFREAGVDLASSETWDQFIENSKRFQKYWADRDVKRRYAFELSESNATFLLAMLIQRGVNLVDDRDQLFITDERVVDTLVTYCKMLIGPDQIATTTSQNNDTFSLDLERYGTINAVMAADWRLKYLRDNASGLAGDMRVMPLPRWPDSEYRTSTIGGTMIGITRNTPDPELAWKMVENLLLDPQGMSELMQATYVIPPVKTAWETPIVKTADPYFGGQHVRELIVDLADEVPPRFVSPASAVAEGELSMVMIDALAYMKKNGEKGLREHCRKLLERSEASIKRRIAHGSFE